MRRRRIRIRDIDPREVYVDAYAPSALKVGDRAVGVDGRVPAGLDMRGEAKLLRRDVPREPLAISAVGDAALEQSHTVEATRLHVDQLGDRGRSGGALLAHRPRWWRCHPDAMTTGGTS